MRSVTATGLSDNLNDGTVTGDEYRESFEKEAGRQAQGGSTEIMRLFRQSIGDSSTYLDQAYRRQWARNDSNFLSQHPPGSKYYSNGYRHRSKIFVPKTRAVLKRQNAAVSSAFFSTQDVIDIRARSQSLDEHAAAAAFWKANLQYRLTREIPWFLTVIGAFQTCARYGRAVSHVYWDYSTDTDGRTVKDQLMIDLVTPEGMRFSPAADWRNPIKSSPFLFHEMPMTVGDVQEKMRQGVWAMAHESQILSATRSYDPTRLEREDDKPDSHTATSVNEHTIVYVYRAIMNFSGVDYLFYVLGDTMLLTEPTPLIEVTPNGERDYGTGIIDVEAFAPIPQSTVQQLEELQADINNVKNTRHDNIELALNKRYTIRRGGGVDMASLMRQVPGGGVLVNEHNDVREFVTQDVTSSSFQEENFTTSGFDEIAGSFNPGSINNNRRVGETAAGMELLASDSNVMTEYQIKTFAETFMQETLHLALSYVQEYENDPEVIAMSAEKSGIREKFGIEEITTDMLNESLSLTVNVGVDATNPMRAVERLTMGVSYGAELGVLLDGKAVWAEIMGKLGFDNGDRFLEEQQEGAEGQGQPPSPEEQALAAQQQMEAQKVEMEGQKMQLEGQKLQLQQQIEQGKIQLETQKMQSNYDLKMADIAARNNMKVEELEAKVSIAAMQDMTQREIEALRVDEAFRQAVQQGMEVRPGE